GHPVGEGELERVALHERRGRPGGGQHAVGEVDPHGPDPAGAQGPAQVAGATGEVDDDGAGGEAERAHRAAPPALVHPEGHHPVDQVVPGGDRVEHAPDGRDLVAAAGQLVGQGRPGHRAHRTGRAPADPTPERAPWRADAPTLRHVGARSHFRIFGIPVRVEPFFVIVAALFGLHLEPVWLVFAWIVIVFVSILVHEMGHALTYRAFGQRSAIVL